MQDINNLEALGPQGQYSGFVDSDHYKYIREEYYPWRFLYCVDVANVQGIDALPPALVEFML